MDHTISPMIVRISACLSLLVILALVGSLPHAQAGELYQWKDMDGNVYLSDTPPDASVHQGEVKSTYTTDEPVAAAERKTAATQPPTVRQKDVTIYTNTT